MQPKERIKTAVLKELQKIIIESLTDESVFDEQTLGEVCQEVRSQIDSKAVSFDVFSKEYERGFGLGLKKVATWLTDEQLRPHYTNLEYYGDHDLQELPEEIGKQCAYLAGYKDGADTGHWFDYCRKNHPVVKEAVA